MRDVAEAVGVSITTVSHIVNQTRPVASETRERVLEAITRLNYYKNATGRRLARGRSDSFGLIISDFDNPFYGELIKNFEVAVQERGCDILLCTTNYEPERARLAVARMIENSVLGVAIMTTQIDAALVDELVGRDIPVVRLDAGLAARARSNISVDYSAGVRQAIAYLRELGHTGMAFIAGCADRVSSERYRQAVLKAAADLDFTITTVIEGNNQMEGGEAGVRCLLAEPKLPTAILCTNDLVALGAIRALVENGLRVPADISVIGADDIAFARYGAPSLTTVRIPRDQMGRFAFDALDRMVRTKRRLPIAASVETRLVVRESTGPAAART
jgi:DNA-binding LacI/PurR family transcriptional regulator